MVIRALRAARDAATGLLDVQKHQCYDKAFLQLATDLIAEAEIILAHSQAEDMKKVVRRFQKGVEAVRSDYPSKIGAIIVWMYSDEDIIAEDTPLEVATMLDLYTRALRVLRYVLLSNLPDSIPWLTICWLLATQSSFSVTHYFQSA